MTSILIMTDHALLRAVERNISLEEIAALPPEVHVHPDHGKKYRCDPTTGLIAALGMQDDAVVVTVFRSTELPPVRSIDRKTGEVTLYVGSTGSRTSGVRRWWPAVTGHVLVRQDPGSTGMCTGSWMTWRSVDDTAKERFFAALAARDAAEKADEEAWRARFGYATA